jgi:hypothetical protein
LGLHAPGVPCEIGSLGCARQIRNGPLTRPWIVDKKYLRGTETHPEWIEHISSENQAPIKIGHEHYFLSADGRLMPTRKDSRRRT